MAATKKQLSTRPTGRFAAIDFETADYGRDSACALAVVIVEGVQIVRQEYFLIQPPRQQFAFTDIHGIRWNDVAQAAPVLRPLASGGPSVRGCGVPAPQCQL